LANIEEYHLFNELSQQISRILAIKSLGDLNLTGILLGKEPPQEIFPVNCQVSGFLKVTAMTNLGLKYSRIMSC
jgi:hypothetical protein